LFYGLFTTINANIQNQRIIKMNGWAILLWILVGFLVIPAILVLFYMVIGLAILAIKIRRLLIKD